MLFPNIGIWNSYWNWQFLLVSKNGDLGENGQNLKSNLTSGLE
jgi:hypothetical protein